nr:MAG TPA: RloB-like protein [Caudoviricetes sp.]
MRNFSNYCFEYAHLTQDNNQELGRLGLVNL